MTVLEVILPKYCSMGKDTGFSSSPISEGAFELKSEPPDYKPNATVNVNLR